MTLNCGWHSFSITMLENELGASLRQIKGCLTKILSSTCYILQKAAMNFQNSLSPMASLLLGDALEAKGKGVVSKIFLEAQPPDPSFPLRPKVFNRAIHFFIYKHSQKQIYIIGLLMNGSYATNGRTSVTFLKS